MSVELLLGGHYQGEETFLGTFTFLKLLPGERWVFAESLDPAYDFPGRVKALGIEALSLERPSGYLEDSRTKVSWSRYRRGSALSALNSSGEIVGRLADALEDLHPSTYKSSFRFQVEVVGPGQLRPTTHDVVLSYVAEEPTEPNSTDATRN
jgi:hypothetical protein